MFDLDKLGESTAGRWGGAWPKIIIGGLAAMAIIALPLLSKVDRATEDLRGLHALREAGHAGDIRRAGELHNELLRVSSISGIELEWNHDERIKELADIASTPLLLRMLDPVEPRLKSGFDSYFSDALDERYRIVSTAENPGLEIKPNVDQLQHPAGGVYRDALALRFSEKGYDEIAQAIMSHHIDQLFESDLLDMIEMQLPNLPAGMSLDRIETLAWQRMRVNINGLAAASKRNEVQAYFAVKKTQNEVATNE